MAEHDPGSQGAGFSARRGRPGFVALAAAAALLVMLVGMVAAQGGHGGRGRGGRSPAPPTNAPAAPAAPAAKSDAAPGEYPLEFPQVLAAIDRGEGHAALASYERTAAAAEASGNRLLAARAWAATSSTAVRLGLYQKAIRAGTRAIELFRGELAAGAPVGADDVGTLASAYSTVGGVWRQVGQLDRARAVLEEGLALAESRLRGPREALKIEALTRGIAQIALAQRDHPTALALSTQSVHRLEAVIARLPSGAPARRRSALRRQAAIALRVMGQAEIDLGHPREAEAAFDRALRHAREVGLGEIELEILQSQGQLALTRGNAPAALAFFDQGRILGVRIRRTGALVWIEHGRARALQAMGRMGEALDAAREAMRHVEGLRGGLDESDLRSGFAEGRQRIYQHAVRLALAAGRAEEAFSFAERGRARAFLDLLGSHTALSKGRTRALAEEESRLRARLALIEARAQDGDDEDAGERPGSLPDAAQEEYRAFLERIRRESGEQASLMVVEPVTIPEIQQLLPAGTTLLEYLIAEDGAVVWVVDRERVTVVRLPGDRGSLLAQVQRFRSAIAKQEDLPAVEIAATALYRRLLEPARAAIRGDRLVIIPHGVLHYLPWGALRSPAGRWVIEDFTLATLPSASVLRYLPDKDAGVLDGALAVGNPDAGTGLDLRWAEREARVVRDRGHAVTLLLRDQATEAEVKRRLETVGLIHFATHAELDEADPLASALLLVPGGGEDGRLEVRELLRLDLHARLIVLSACETGLGRRSRGDELVGLLRAFLYAGTTALITTLWKIDDRVSYELVRAFYDRLERAGAGGALREAQLETMRSHPHPFGWAAFALTGSPR